MSKNFGNPRKFELSSWPEIPENVVPFAPENFWRWELEVTGIFGWMESPPVDQFSLSVYLGTFEKAWFLLLLVEDSSKPRTKSSELLALHVEVQT